MERNDEMSDMKKIVLADASEEFRRMLAELVAEEPELPLPWLEQFPEIFFRPPGCMQERIQFF